MLPSKAERILSRYRPIAPKPLPLPPSGSFGTTDPSSTCASVDSFTSSAKCKKSRKRKADDAASVKVLKAPKSIGSGLSNTAGASSLTQGVSDGTVPLGDLRSTSQVSHGSIPFGMQDGTELSNGATKEVRRMASEVRFTPYSSVVAPMYVGDAGKLVQTQGLFMPAENSAQQQRQLTLLHQRLSSGCNSNGVAVMDKDAGFMERAAAASVSACVGPDRPAAVQACDVGYGKSVGYAGGGFTEMIRGITRLPTAADVQSLMQARASTSPVLGQGAGAGAAASSPGALRGSPTCSKEMPHQKLDPPSHMTSVPHTWLMRSPSQADVDHGCEREADLVTLTLLPNIPSRMSSSSMASHRDRSPSAQASSQGSYNLEPAWQQVCSRVEPPAVLASRSVGSSHSGMQLATGCSLFPVATKKVASGLVMPSMNSTVMQAAASSIMADGATIDQGYLEQVYGGSTDPVVLVDDSNKVLWFNKSYDRALKSATERLSGKTIPTGPYIDPLGHPTPLGSFVFPVHGKPVRATLRGFLKKLVTQESHVKLEGALGPSSKLRLSMGGASQRVSPVCMEHVSRVSPVVCSGNARVTTVTVESITEIHMDALPTAECVEAAEARLGAGSEPAFITDCLNRVIWVNGALKQMLGHMSFDGSSTRMMPHSKGVDGPMCSPTEGPSFVMCCTEKVPRSAWAFSCRINLEWIKGGKRRSMTVPCDVTRTVGNTRVSEVNWVWQFDMAVSLCLNASS